MGLMVQYIRLHVRLVARRFVRDERGLETIEIVLIAALVIVGSIGLWGIIGKGVIAQLFALCEGIVGKGKCN